MSAELESIDYDDELAFEESFQEEGEEVIQKKTKNQRSKNLEYTFIEVFENKDGLDKFWQENDFEKLYYHHLERTSTSTVIFLVVFFTEIDTKRIKLSCLTYNDSQQMQK